MNIILDIYLMMNLTIRIVSLCVDNVRVRVKLRLRTWVADLEYSWECDEGEEQLFYKFILHYKSQHELRKIIKHY